MRTLILFSIAIMLTAVSCKKEDCTEWQTVDVTGNYINTPDPAGGFNQVTLPDGAVLQTPKKYKVSGSDNVIGTLNATQSVLEVTSIGLNFKTGAFDLVLHIVLYNTSGETIVMDGTAQFYADNTGLSWMHYTSGYRQI